MEIKTLPLFSDFALQIFWRIVFNDKISYNLRWKPWVLIQNLVEPQQT